MTDNRYSGDWGRQPRNSTNPLLWVILVLLVVLVVIATATATWWLLSQRPGMDGATPSQNLVIEPEGDVESVDATPADRPGQPMLPASAVAANPAAQSGSPAGDLNNVYTGSDVTSVPFALNVRDAYVSHYLETGAVDAVLQVTSPVTGQAYSMDCSDNGAYITCTGGDNAVVYIA